MKSSDAMVSILKEYSDQVQRFSVDESFVDGLISNSGGNRVTREEAGYFAEKNADYILGTYVLELKQFEQEGLDVPTRQEKIAELFSRYSSYSAFHNDSNNLPRHRLGKLTPIPSDLCQPYISESDLQG